MIESNLYLQDILNTFSITTGIHITSLNLKGTVLSESKMKNLYNEDFNISKIYKSIGKLEKYSANKLIKYINIKNEKEVAVIFLDSYNSLNNYFIIGPYKTNKDNKANSSITPYRPRYCINYVIEILIKIIEDKNCSSSKEKFLSLNIKKTIEYVHKFYENPLTIELLSKDLNLHKCYFCTSFKQETGMTFTNFLSKFRIEKSKELLKNKSLSILDVAIAVGFNNQSYYTMAFKKFMNMTPLEYRKHIFKFN